MTSLEALRQKDPEFRESDGAFRREHLFAQIEVGDRVTIEYPARPSFYPQRDCDRQFGTGRATINNTRNGVFVLNMGGRHGTPGIATPENTVSVIKAGKGKPLKILKPIR